MSEQGWPKCQLFLLGEAAFRTLGGSPPSSYPQEGDAPLAREARRPLCQPLP